MSKIAEKLIEVIKEADEFVEKGMKVVMQFKNLKDEFMHKGDEDKQE